LGGGERGGGRKEGKERFDQGGERGSGSGGREGLDQGAEEFGDGAEKKVYSDESEIDQVLSLPSDCPAPECVSGEGRGLRGEGVRESILMSHGLKQGCLQIVKTLCITAMCGQGMGGRDRVGERVG